MGDTAESGFNLRGRSTGLPMNIWIGPRRHPWHAARIKVQMDHRAKFDLDRVAVVGVATEPAEVIEGWLRPADLGLIQHYVTLNRPAILDHWNEVTDGVELALALKPLWVLHLDLRNLPPAPKVAGKT